MALTHVNQHSHEFVRLHVSVTLVRDIHLNSLAPLRDVPELLAVLG